MLRSFKTLGALSVLGTVWLGSMIGPTGMTLGSFTAASVNNGNLFKTATSFGTAPTVSSMSPASGATSVPTDSSISVTFSEPMTTATTNAATSFTTSGSPVTGTATWYSNNTLLVFAPSTPLSATTTYTFTIGTGATDSTSGLHLAAATTTTFTTGTTTANEQPQVISTSPVNSASNVASNTWIVITFSQPMQLTTLQGHFHVDQTAVGGSTNTVPCYYAGTDGNGACSQGTDGSLNSNLSLGGPNQNILIYKPPSWQTSANVAYSVTIDGGAGNALDAFGKAMASSYTFSFTMDGSTLAAPSISVTAPTSPGAWTHSSTFVVTGTVNKSAALVQVWPTSSCNTTAVAAEQLNLTDLNFSISTPLTTGTNTLWVNASNAAGSSACTALATIHRDDASTTPGTLAITTDSDKITVIAPYSGDANSNAYAIFTCTGSESAGGGTTGCPAGVATTNHISGAAAGTTGQFSSAAATTSAFTGLSASTSHTITAEIDDADGVTCGGSWTQASATQCTQTVNNVVTISSTASGTGTITSLSLTPNSGVSTTGLIAPRAGQRQSFNFDYNCGTTAACTGGSPTSSAEVIISQATSLVRICQSYTPSSGNVSGARLFWDGKDSSGSYLANGTYNYEIRIFDDSGCGTTAGSTFVQNTTGTVGVQDAISATVSNDAGGPISTGQSTTISAIMGTASSGKVADGNASIPNTGAGVTFTAVGSVSSSGFHLGGQSIVNGTSQVTSYVGETDPSSNCTPAAGSGTACAYLTVDQGIAAQIITVTATTTGANGSTVSGTTTVTDPPAPPSGIVLTPGSIWVQWNPSTTPNVIGYKISLGKTSGLYDRTIDAGNVTSYHIVDVDPGTTYFVAVQAYTAEGLASVLKSSLEASITLDGPTVTPTATNTSTPTVTSTATATSTPTRTSTSTATATSTATSTVTSTPTSTITPDPTATTVPGCGPGTPTYTPTTTSTPTAIIHGTATRTPTATPTVACPTATTTAAATGTATSTGTAVPNATATATDTVGPSPTVTNTPAGATYTATATATRSSTSTPTMSATATLTATTAATSTATRTATHPPAPTATP